MPAYFARVALRATSWLAILSSLFIPAWAAESELPGLDPKWRHYRSQHFELYSRVSEGDSRDILTRLETMRAFFVSYFEWPVRDPAEVTIYCFGSQSQFAAYLPPGMPARNQMIGEYRPYHDRDVISLSDSLGERAALWIVYSNYTKHLLNSAARNRASWLYQGLGMFMGNFESGAKGVRLGEPDDLRERLARQNNKVKIEELMPIEEGISGILAQEQADIFHAQSWAVVHYLYCGQTEVPVTDVNRFVRFLLCDKGALDAERRRLVFETIFKVNYATMNERLSRYLRAGRFRGKTHPLPTTTTPNGLAMRPVALDEMRERLAELKLRGNAGDGSRYVMVEALGGPRAARAAEVLGFDAARARDDRQASDYWRRAIEAGSRNRAVLHLVAHLEFARWFSHFDYYFRLNAEKAEELRALLATCLELSPNRAETIEALAWVEAAAPQPNLANVALVQDKFPSLSSPSRTLLAIALIHSRLGDHASALSILERLPTFEPTTAEARFAEMVRPLIQEKARRAREAAQPTDAAPPAKS